MTNFTKSEITIGSKIYFRYEADRKRGGSAIVFFNSIKKDDDEVEIETYAPTWPYEIKDDATLSGLKFISRLIGDIICIDFETELTTAQEDALDAIYTSHLAPVAI